jgi:predicted nucleic acid-binding protein
LREIVLDASVAAKWVLPQSDEPYGEEARKLLEAASNGELEFWVPDIFWAELGNVIWKAHRRGRIDSAKAAEAIRDLLALEVQVLQSRELAGKAFSIATDSQISVYDACYVELANRLDIPLVTADRALFARTAPALPVVWIGAIH